MRSDRRYQGTRKGKVDGKVDDPDRTDDYTGNTGWVGGQNGKKVHRLFVATTSVAPLRAEAHPSRCGNDVGMGRGWKGVLDYAHTNAGSPSTLTAKVSLGGNAGASSAVAATRPPDAHAKSARHVRTVKARIGTLSESLI